MWQGNPSIRGVGVSIDRRRFVGSAAVAMAGEASSAYSLRPKHYPDRRRPLSRVALIATNTYAGALVNAVLEGLRLFHLNVRGKSVVLKPNLVESFSGPVCTHPALVIAAVQCFQRMGASSVIVAEGPRGNAKFLPLKNAGVLDRKSTRLNSSHL